jgi:hypothetical protein
MRQMRTVTRSESNGLHPTKAKKTIRWRDPISEIRHFETLEDER